MASYVEGIVVQQAGVAQAGTVSPQIAQMFAHINAELGKCKLEPFQKWKIKYVVKIGHVMLEGYIDPVEFS